MTNPKTYEEIVRALKQPFPKGTVHETSEYRAHIPVQVYMKRLEDVAAEQWHWRIIGEPLISLQERYVVVKGELFIAGAVRQGISSATLKNGDVKELKSALSTAESEAFRDACDKYLMGWTDLAPYRDWGKSPAIRFESVEGALSKPIVAAESGPTMQTSALPISHRKCTRCQIVLTGEDELALSLYGVNLPYCAEHIPAQFKKDKVK